MSNKSAATYGPGRTTPPLEARVHFEVALVVTNVSNWPDAAAAHLLGRDLNGPINMLVEALMPVIAEAQAEAWEQSRRALFDFNYESVRTPGTPIPANPYRSAP